jgi:CRP/FNR family transcriptional regulator, cyclic AMP receptor protein
MFATISGVPNTKPNRNETLSRVAIFSGLSEAELAFLAQRTVPRRFSAGETVFAEGEPCTGLYVVESGHVRIFKSSAGEESTCSALRAPEVLSPSFRYLMGEITRHL